MSARISVVNTERLVPQCDEKVVALSLLDCTTANFAYGSAVWLFSPPTFSRVAQSDLYHHLRSSLAIALEHYPQWCGHLKVISTTDGEAPAEAAHLAPHARRFGRIYAHFGTSQDPGVEFTWATSLETANSLYPIRRTEDEPIWDCQNVPFLSFIPTAKLANLLQPNEKDESGALKPLMAIQVTQLACGGLVLALKSTHPMADTTTFVNFVKDWALVSRTRIAGNPTPKPIFDPALLDSQAAGDINTPEPDAAIIQKAVDLPLHRYDWWASSKSCPWPFQIPSPFDKEDLEPAGNMMPWAEWDITALVSNHVIHFNRRQVDLLWEEAKRVASQKLSRHDAVLGHIWSCIARARGLSEDVNPIHCDLVYGVRQSFQLSDKFFGSPTMMINIEMPGSAVARPPNLGNVATQIRRTLLKVVDQDSIAAHLHSVAYEKSPQRIWQAFLGRRHILVTTWARAGMYEVDFGLGCTCIYVEGIVPDMDGNILIKEAPGKSSQLWTDNGVDVSVRIKTEDMARLIKDPLLLPLVES